MDIKAIDAIRQRRSLQAVAILFPVTARCLVVLVAVVVIRSAENTIYEQGYRPWVVGAIGGKIATRYIERSMELPGYPWMGPFHSWMAESINGMQRVQLFLIADTDCTPSHRASTSRQSRHSQDWTLRANSFSFSLSFFIFFNLFVLSE